MLVIQNICVISELRPAFLSKAPFNNGLSQISNNIIIYCTAMLRRIMHSNSVKLLRYGYRSSLRFKLRFFLYNRKCFKLDNDVIFYLTHTYCILNSRAFMWHGKYNSTWRNLRNSPIPLTGNIHRCSMFNSNF